MGDYWATWLADVIHDEGCNILEWSGWQSRSASSGGFSGKPGGVINHHTASGTSSHGKPDWNYACFNGSNSPEYNIGIDPNGLVNILAAGGVNSSGSGGPLSLPSGTYRDNVNYKLIAVSYGNRGDGSEPYSNKMIDAGVKSNAAILRHLGYGADCATSHKEWTGSQSVCPGRKIDPFGPWESGHDWGSQSGSAPFGLTYFRNRIEEHMEGEDMPLSKEDIDKIAEAVWAKAIDTTGKDAGIEAQPARYWLQRTYLICRQAMPGFNGKPAVDPTMLKQIHENTK